MCRKTLWQQVPLRVGRLRLGPLAALALLGGVAAGCAAGTPGISRAVSVDVIPSTSAELTLRRLGGAGADWAESVLCATDGCALFGFSIKSFGESTDYVIYSETPAGQLRWARTYGGTHRDALACAAPAAAGGYLLVGESQSLFFTALKVMSPSRPPRPFLVRTDAAGVPAWAATIDVGVTDLLGCALLGAGHLVVGRSPSPRQRSAPVVIRLGADGEIGWARRYELAQPALASSVLVRGENIVVVGYTYDRDSLAADRPFLLALDASGTVRWARLFEGPKRWWAGKLARTPDGGVVVSGASHPEGSPERPVLFGVGPDGALRWAHAYQLDRSPGEAISIAPGQPGEFLVTGRFGDVNARQQAGFGLLVDEDGRVLSSTAVAAPGANVDLRSGALDGEGRYRLIGHTDGLGSAATDVLSVIWTPSTRAGGELAIQTLPLEARSILLGVESAPIEPAVTRIRVEHLEGATLTVP